MRCQVWEVPQKLNMWYICIKSRIHHPNFVRVPEVVRCMHWWNSESLRSMKIESWGISRRLNAWFSLQKVSHSDIVLWAPISSLAGHIVMKFFKKSLGRWKSRYGCQWLDGCTNTKWATMSSWPQAGTTTISPVLIVYRFIACYCNEEKIYCSNVHLLF